MPHPAPRTWALSLVTATLLAGCSPPVARDIQAAARAANQELAVAIKDVEAVNDPLDAFKQLDAAESRILKANNPCPSHGPCEDVPAWNTSAELRVSYLATAIEAKRPEAFVVLYNLAGPEYKQLRHQSGQRLLECADTVRGTAEDRPVLMLAGQVVAEGNDVMRDTARAVGYYARAWAAGESQAAQRAARQFLGINDLRNAYLWSLRCTAGCERGDDLALPRLEQSLSPEAARQAQEIAPLASVVELETSSGG
jgi:hypothetical protein